MDTSESIVLLFCRSSVLTRTGQNEQDEAAHLVCADGEILHVEPQGRAMCTALDQLDGYVLNVYV